MQNRIRFKFPIRTTSVVLALFYGVFVVIGCNPPEDKPPAPAKACVAGELTLPDGRCQPAGLPLDMQCAPGELALEDGTCEPAGVPADACGQGFVADGNQGCEPMLPAQECPFGMMAVPGDAECREVAPCGTGTWGDIPFEVNTQFVDQAYPGNDSDGTQAKPWKTIQEGVLNAGSGAVVAIAAGSYPEDVAIQDKPIRLWGRCPAMVEIVGTGVQKSAIFVQGIPTSGAEIRNVAVTGAAKGIRVAGSTGVVIEDAWIHDAGGYGLQVDDANGPTKVTLRNALLEQNAELGVFVFGAEITIEDSVVRDTVPNAQMKLGRGMEIEDDPAQKLRSNVTVRHSVVEKNRQVAILVAGSDAIVEASVLRKTRGNAPWTTGYGIEVVENPTSKSRANVAVRGSLIDDNRELGAFVHGGDVTIENTMVRGTLANGQGNLGRGIQIQDEFTETRSNAIIRHCVVEKNHQVGVSIFGSDAIIEATVVRETLPNSKGNFGEGIEIGVSATTAHSVATIRGCVIEGNHNFGVGVFGSTATVEDTAIRGTLPDARGTNGQGIGIQIDKPTETPADVTVRRCMIEENHNAGVLVWGARATIESSVVRNTKRDANGNFGRGIGAQDDAATKMRADMTIRSCLVEENYDVGVAVFGSDATIHDTVIRTTQPNVLEQLGNGIAIQENPATQARANATLQNCLVEQNHETGVYVHGSDVTIEKCVVRETAHRGAKLFGDGISIDHGSAKILDTEIRGNPRAGVANFASQVVITRGIFACNGFDVEGEAIEGIPFSFEGTRGWQCGGQGGKECVTVGNNCSVQSTGIIPPGQVEMLPSSMP